MPSPAGQGIEQAGDSEGGRARDVGCQREARVRGRGQPGADQIDAARGQAVRQRQQDRDGGDVGCEEDADQPSSLGLGQVPAFDVAGQQRRSSTSLVGRAVGFLPSPSLSA
jgi:hypothetical protein